MMTRKEQAHIRAGALAALRLLGTFAAAVALTALAVTVLVLVFTPFRP